MRSRGSAATAEVGFGGEEKILALRITRLCGAVIALRELQRVGSCRFHLRRTFTTRGARGDVCGARADTT